MRDSVGMVDLTAFNEFDIEGPGAVAGLQHIVVNNVDVPVGKSIYTPLLTPAGGFRGDLTIQRLGDEHFRVITGAFDGGRDQYWFRKHLPADGSVTFTDRSQSLCTLGLWGPNAAAVLGQGGHSGATQGGRRGRRLAGGVPVRLGARPADRRHPVHAVPHLLRRRERVGDLHAHGARTAPVGHDRRGRRGVRHRARRHRRVRRHRADREGLPADGRRAGERVRPRRGRPRPAQGQVGRLHRQGGLPRRPRSGRGQRSGGDAVHADDDRPHVGGRHRRATRSVATSRS